MGSFFFNRFFFLRFLVLLIVSVNSANYIELILIAEAVITPNCARERPADGIRGPLLPTRSVRQQQVIMLFPVNSGNRALTDTLFAKISRSPT
jgi:hypothetical protein